MTAMWGPGAIEVAALEQLPAVVWAFVGPDHVAVFANRAAREYHGGSRAHLLGTSLRASLLAENRRLVDLLDEVYRGGTTRTFYETGIRVDDEQRFVTFTASPLRDDNGEVAGVLSYMTDVTEAVLAKQAAEREQAALHTLQESLLPGGLPVLPELLVAARYRAAGTHVVAGGDWYDAALLGGGRVAASVGDVIGHGPVAAALMGQLRSVLHSALLETGDAVRALTQLQRFVTALPGARGSTACAVVVDLEADTGGGRLRYACAGHPPPILVGRDGTARFLPAPPSAPLGMIGPPPILAAAELAPGESVLLYTDGAIERPGTATDLGRDRLLAACAAAARYPTAELVDRVLADVLGDATEDGQADDLALLALSRRPAAVPVLELRYAALPRHLRAIRRRLGDWLSAAQISQDDILAVQIACGEATANAVEHAYPAGGPGGELRLSATLTEDSAVVLRVEDGGRWREPPVDPADRGRGLMLMRRCMDEVRVHSLPDGTAITLVRRVHGGRPPVLASPAATSSSELDVRLRTTAGGVRAVLVGDLDAAGATVAAPILQRATRAGQLPLHLDLTGLGHLASAGVRLLFELADELTTAGRGLTVQVASASSAHFVLDLTGFTGVATVAVTPAAADRDLQPADGA